MGLVPVLVHIVLGVNIRSKRLLLKSFLQKAVSESGRQSYRKQRLQESNMSPSNNPNFLTENTPYFLDNLCLYNVPTHRDIAQILAAHRSLFS